MHTTLADLTTMRLGGPARQFEVADSTDQAINLLRECDAAGERVLVVGGGSNLVVGDDGFDGLVLRMASSRIHVDGDSITAEAGTSWDSVVETALAAGLGGLETLSGIPGSAGATPVQNVGAYGALTSDLLRDLTVYDRHTKTTERWAPNRCGFGRHRQSVFKNTDRYLVLDVTFGLARDKMSRPIQYSALADRLGIEIDDTAPLADVRAAVLSLRAERGMLLDPDDHDTWSVGSFFINPVLPEIPDSAHECPRYPDPGGVKLPAAWLIEHAGFSRGYGQDWGSGTVALSTKHVLAVSNRGSATTTDVMRFAGHIRDGVAERFGIVLGPECHLVDCAFDSPKISS